jgi:hypothetical protein
MGQASRSQLDGPGMPEPVRWTRHEGSQIDDSGMHGLSTGMRHVACRKTRGKSPAFPRPVEKYTTA